MSNKPSILKRLITSLNERRGMNAYANVMSGRRAPWYTRPLGWVVPLGMLGMIVFSVVWEVVRYVGIPLLVVCMFVTLHRMNDKLDVIEAQLNGPSDTRLILEWIEDKIEETETE